MALKEMIDRDCGGSNPLMKLTTHFTEDKAQNQHGLLRFPLAEKEILGLDQRQHNDLVDEYLYQLPTQNAPTSFRMDSLLQEVHDIEKLFEMPLKKDPTSADIVAESWASEYADNLPEERSWIDEYLQVAPPGDRNLVDGGLWADEFLEYSETKCQSKEKSQMNSEAAKTATSVLAAIDQNDPKFANSKFVKFLRQLEEGSINIERTPTQTANLKADEWVNEFIQNDTNDVQLLPTISNEFSEEFFLNEQNVPEQSWEEWSRDMNTNKTSGEEWTNEFQTEQQTDFWDNLQKHWDDLAKQDVPEASNWLSDYDNFDVSTYYKDYQFESDNPLLNEPDAFREGLERLKKGEISNAVLLFEAAVKKEPGHSEAWQYLGTTQASNEQDPAAIAALHKCLELDPMNLTAMMSLAVSYTNESMQGKACDALYDWLRQNPKYQQLLTSNEHVTSSANHRITSFMSMEYHNEIKDFFLKAVQLNPNEIDADVQVGLGILFNLSGEYDKAVDCFKAALQIKLEDALIWNKLGATLANGGRSEESVDAFRNALALTPGYVRTRHNLGVACINLGVHREAMEHFLAALNLQKSGRGPKGTNTVMSDNIWSSVRTTATLLGRADLYETCETRNLDRLNKEFNAVSRF